MITLAGLLEEQTEAARVLVDTGLSSIDGTTGGLRGGQVWIVTGLPGEGTSLLLLQLALRAALNRHQTALYVPRQERHDLKRRIVSHLTRRPVREALHEATEDDLRHASSLPLWIYTGMNAASDLACDRTGICVVDDADLVTTPDEVRRMVRSGGTLVLGLPHDEVVTSTGLRHAWARVADVVLQVETGTWSDSDPTEPSTIRLLKHRWGPVCTQPVWFEPAVARFRDMTPEVLRDFAGEDPRDS